MKYHMLELNSTELKTYIIQVEHLLVLLAKSIFGFCENLQSKNIHNQKGKKEIRNNMKGEKQKSTSTSNILFHLQVAYNFFPPPGSPEIINK